MLARARRRAWPTEHPTSAAAAGRAAAAAVDRVGEPMMELTRASRDRDAWGQDPLGDPRAFKHFEVHVKWWLAGEGWRHDSYNVAGRFVVRQTGAARARAELFEPEGLAGDDPVMEDGEAIRPGDPTAGIDGRQGARRPDGGRGEG